MANAEILSIGTELLLGNVLDTNAQFLSLELAKLGIDCYYRITVGDNKERIKLAVRSALSRAQLVIMTGGLGPTPDDLTVETLAELFQVPLILDESTLSRIKMLFARRGIIMPESNRKQAFYPQGAELMQNPNGTAPGIKWILAGELLQRISVNHRSTGRVILAFPGVPSELHAMWQEIAYPFLQGKYMQSTLWSCELKHYGIGESALAEMFAHLLPSKNPTVAPYAGVGECRLRVTAKARTVEEAVAIAQPVIEEIKRVSGVKCYGEDEDTLESVVGHLLASARLTLSVSESCTGGLVSKRLTDVPGSSRYIQLNVVAYANEAKQKLLGVSEEILEKYGAVSEQCAAAMATGVRALAQSDIGLSITGIAGPEGGTSDKPVGLVYLGIATSNCVETKELRFGQNLTRDEIRYGTASEALDLVRMCLMSQEFIRQNL